MDVRGSQKHQYTTERPLGGDFPEMENLMSQLTREKIMVEISQRVDGEESIEVNSEKRFLTREEEHLLGKRIQSGDVEALHTLVLCNIDLVTSLAKRYRYFGLSSDDLVGEGTVGLVEAARRFDPYRGTRFSTYAVWSVKRAMIKAVVEQRGVVNLPYHKSSLLFKIKRADKELSQQNAGGYNSSAIARQVGASEEEVRRISHVVEEHVSFDSPVDSEGGNDYYELWCDEHIEDPSQLFESGEMQGQVDAAIDILPERERNIVKMHYGLDGHQEKTFVEIANEMGLSRQRVQQLESRAMTWLQESLKAAVV
jgi:RNA polymerase primary sigma factor